MIDVDETGIAVPFSDASTSLGTLAVRDAAALAMAAGDITLVVDRGGVVRDAAGSGRGVANLHHWIGRKWADLVTVECRPKVAQMLADTAAGVVRWRQVNHVHEGGEMPVRYLAFAVDGGRRILAIGRDVRAAAALQQRLLQAQQSLERDYLRLRQAESRYRLLFEMSVEPLLIVDAASRRIREINEAGSQLLGGAPAGQLLAGRIARSDRDIVTGFLGAVAAGAKPAPVGIRLEGVANPVTLAASVFRQAGGNYFLLRIDHEDTAPGLSPLAEVIERMPDGFVLTDSALTILAFNDAFSEMVQAHAPERLTGGALGDLLGRPGIDLDLILGHLAEQDAVRNVSTILRGLDGGQEEIELSAVRIRNGGDHYGFSIRAVSRRLRHLPPAERDLPRSVEQLTELVGRMPLRDIVRESTDLIERLCIEAALDFTADNRASAAEILGLSRQSLYGKLHRHGLGNLGGEQD